MKKALTMLLAVWMLLLPLNACGSRNPAGDGGKDTKAETVGERPEDSKKIKQAEERISQGDLAGAKKILEEMKGSERAEKMLRSFQYVLTGISGTSFNAAIDYNDDYTEAHAFFGEGNTWEIAVDKAGHLIKRIEASDEQSISYSYDAEGRDTGYSVTKDGVISETLTCVLNGHGDTTEARYDYPDGNSYVRKTEYGYDAQGHILYELTSEASVTGMEVLTYDEDGNLIKRVFLGRNGNFATRNLTYNEDNQLIHEEYSWNSDVTHFFYHYDSAGRMIRDEYVSGDFSIITERKYDENGNLVKVTGTTGSEPNETLEFQYRLVYSETDLSAMQQLFLYY